MRAACLILLVALMLQDTLSIYTTSSISRCCSQPINRLKSDKIKSYNRTNDIACKQKAFVVELKTGKEICVNAASKTVILAIEEFDKKAKKSNEMTHANEVSKLHT
ncbi:regakine-1-like [Eleutherodactylus coqui]|uniref:regakine-1-like n=1 Tax=Eleutherodactylus coqui TaxID=57060 RepID=UPI0034630D00